MPRARYFRLILPLMILFGTFTFYSIRYGDGTPRFPHFHTHGAQSARDPLQFKAHPGGLKSVHNETLGFQKIFVISLPEREDKLDAFTLASSLTGFNADTMQGVYGGKIVNKTLPSTDRLPPNEEERLKIIGRWRTHMNFARKMLTSGLTTALVMEEDADWSTYLRNQLVLFAVGTQYILNTPPGSHPKSPYGDGWDILWLGHCGSTIRDNDQRRFVVENDNTVPLPQNRFVAAQGVDMQKEGFGDRTRVIYEAGSGSCTYAYALSAAGARKVLHWNGGLKELVPVDKGLGRMCQEAENFRCLSVFPTLMDRFARAGEEVHRQVHNREYTPNILHSQRLNEDKAIKNEALGDGNGWRQFDEPAVEGPARTRTMNRQPVA